MSTAPGDHPDTDHPKTDRPDTASLDKRPAEVAAMFDRVARRYDLTNTVLTAGIDRRWRARTRRALDLRPGQWVLDVAAGTGVSTAEIADAGVRAVACDFSVGMLRTGRARADRRHLPFVAGDALHLPFADGRFDAVTVSFGLRNMVDVPAALAEFARVTRPGGTLVICEFSHPPNPVLRGAWERGLAILPAVARRVSSHAEAYGYLRDSVRAWPDQAALARTIAGTGWGGVHWRDLTFGAVALHKAVKEQGPGA